MCQGFDHSSGFVHHFVLPTSSIRVNIRNGMADEVVSVLGSQWAFKKAWCHSAHSPVATETGYEHLKCV